MNQLDAFIQSLEVKLGIKLKAFTSEVVKMVASPELQIIVTLDKILNLTIWDYSNGFTLKPLIYRNIETSKHMVMHGNNSNLVISAKHKCIVYRCTQIYFWYYQDDQVIEMDSNIENCNEFILSPDENFLAFISLRSLYFYSFITQRFVTKINNSGLFPFILIGQDNKIYSLSRFFVKTLEIYDLNDSNYYHQVTLEYDSTT